MTHGSCETLEVVEVVELNIAHRKRWRVVESF